MTVINLLDWLFTFRELQMTMMLLEMNPQLLDQLGISVKSIYDDIKRMEKTKLLKVSISLSYITFVIRILFCRDTKYYDFSFQCAVTIMPPLVMLFHNLFTSAVYFACHLESDSQWDISISGIYIIYVTSYIIHW